MYSLLSLLGTICWTLIVLLCLVGLIKVGGSQYIMIVIAECKKSCTASFFMGQCVALIFDSWLYYGRILFLMGPLVGFSFGLGMFQEVFGGFYRHM